MTSNDKKIIIGKLIDELEDIRGWEDDDYSIGIANGLQTAIDIIDETKAMPEEDVISRDGVVRSIMDRYCKHCTNAVSVGNVSTRVCDRSCDHKKDIDIIMNYGG